MSTADPLRNKARTLHSLARKLSEHLGGRADQEWVASEVHGMMRDLRSSLEELEDDFDLAPESPTEETSADETPSAQAQEGEPPAQPPAAPSAASRERRPRVRDLLAPDTSESKAAFGHPPEPLAEKVETDEAADRSSLESFFGRVGDSLIQAQRSLDERSRHYLADLASQGATDLATLYRIPKVTAELKFALEKVDDRGVNVLVFKQGTQASTLNQQSVQFEIAAVPAPPETLEAVRRQAPNLRWVLDPTQRQRIRSVLKRLEFPGVSPARKKILNDNRQLLEEHFERVLLVLDPDHAEAVFLAFADPEVGPGIGVWHLAVEPAELTLLYRFELAPKSGQDPGRLRDLVASMGERQADFLAGI